MLFKPLAAIDHFTLASFDLNSRPPNVTSPSLQAQNLHHVKPLTSTNMRYTTRLFAAAKTARFLEPNTPTGLTGLFTHPSPRSTLIYLYSSTLEKLAAFPEDSVYRKSTEALTKHRLDIISSVKPEGLEAYNAESKAFIEKYPGVLDTPASGATEDGHRHAKQVVRGQTFIHTQQEKEYDDLKHEWNNEPDEGPVLEGSRTTAERASQAKMGEAKPIDVDWEAVRKVFTGKEPPLTADQ